jgi:3-hydroxybutyryl-CoA dehydrogenase
VDDRLAPLHSIAVIGAGITGRSIAHATALSGFPTILEDILPATLRSAGRDIEELLADSVARGEVSQRDAQQSLARITYASSIEDAVRQTRFVIEAVPDEIESKLEIFSLLDRIARPGTILASSTFSLRITDITDVTHCAERCVGIRFRVPVHAMTSLQVVRAAATTEATLAAAVAVGRGLGKEVDVVSEAVQNEVSG